MKACYTFRAKQLEEDCQYVQYETGNRMRHTQAKTDGYFRQDIIYRPLLISIDNLFECVCRTLKIHHNLTGNRYFISRILFS